MKRTLLVAALALLASACGHRGRPPKVEPTTPAGAAGRAASGDALHVLVGDAVRTIPLEDYVAGCVVAELGSPRADALAAQRARQVQAILCRSYAVASRRRHASEGFDLCAGTHCQVYRAAPSTEVGRLAREAAEETKGQVLVFDGRPIRPLYHAACGGRTSAAQDVWPGDGVPWMVSVEDRGCERESAWIFRVEMAALSRAFAGEERLKAATPLRDVVVANRDAAGRAASVRLVGRSTVLVRGDEFRAAVMRAFGARSLQSALFTVRREAGRLTFQGHGAGHGVGLCQAGAVRLAAHGQSPAAILRHYFPGTTLSRLE